VDTWYSSSLRYSSSASSSSAPGSSWARRLRRGARREAQGAARAKDAPQGSKGGSTGDGSTSRMVQLMDEAATSAPPTITLILQFRSLSLYGVGTFN